MDVRSFPVSPAALGILPPIGEMKASGGGKGGSLVYQYSRERGISSWEETQTVFSL